MPRSLPEILRSAGYTSVIPPVRSSDWSLSVTNPRLYCITRMWGLVSPFRDSEALVCGQWFHTAFAEVCTTPNVEDYRLSIIALLNKRTEELDHDLRKAGYGDTSIETILKKEQESALKASAWAWAALHSTGTPTIRRKDFPTLKEMTPLFKNWEKTYETQLQDLSVEPVRLKSQVDAEIEWKGEPLIVDLKTCSYDTTVRAARCPGEFQTRHYLTCAPHAKGMLHVIIEKPGITYGKHCRSYTWLSASARSGEIATARRSRSGTWSIAETSPPTNDLTEEQAITMLHSIVGVKPKKVFEEEPDWYNYLDAVTNWYNGAGEFTHLRDERVHGSPPILISKTTLDPHDRGHYWKQVEQLHEVQARGYDPLAHLTTDSGVEDGYGNLTPYSKLLFCENPEAWPSLIKEAKLIVKRRDPV